jgi:signal transduction histidine kinase
MAWCGWHTLVAAQGSVDGILLRGLPGVTVTATVQATDASSDQSHLTPPSASDAGWRPLHPSLGRGFGEQVHWVRLVINVPQALLNQPLVIRSHPPNVRDVRIYLPDRQVLELGKATVDQRVLGLPDVAAFFIPNQLSTTVIIRLATQGRILGGFELMSERAYYQFQVFRATLHGILYGALVLILLVNLLNWLTSREGLYGFYVGFVSFSLWASLASNSYLQVNVFANWPLQHGTLQLCAFLGMAATALAFSSRMLRLHAWHPKLGVVADMMAGVLLMLLVPAAFWPSTHPYLWEWVLTAFVVYGSACLVASLGHLMIERSWKNAFLALAYLAFSALLWVSLASVFGLLPATPLNVGMWQIGLVIHLVFLQMALTISSQRQRWLRWQQQAFLQTLKAQTETETRRSRDLQQFIERLTHEFKTPLTVIDSSVQSLRMLTGVDDSQYVVRYARIRRAVRRLNDLLMRSLVDKNSTFDLADKTPETFDLPSLLEAVIGDFSSQEVTCTRDLTLRLKKDDAGDFIGFHLAWIDIKDPSTILLTGNVGWLHAALHHVFDNAIKYGLSGEDILVTVKTAQLDAETKGLEIWVSNRCNETLLETDLPKLFEKYYRRGEQRDIPGAGLGLTVAKHGIQAHGGTFTARLDAPGRLVFQIRLPLDNHA